MMVTISMIKIGFKKSNKCILCFRCQLSKSCYNKQLVFQSSTTVGFASIGKHRNTYPVSMPITNTMALWFLMLENMVLCDTISWET